MSSEKDRIIQLAYGSNLIHECGLALKLSHSCITFSQHIMHRFYKKQSLLDHCMIWICGGCLLLSFKSFNHSSQHHRNYQNRTIHHISVCLCHRLYQRQCQENVRLDFYGAEGHDWKFGIIAAEREILVSVGFRMFTDLRPHHFVLFFIDKLRQHASFPPWSDSSSSLRTFNILLQTAWNFTNDSLLSQLCVFHPPEAVACACIMKALQKLELTLPEGWQAVFGSSIDECEQIIVGINEMYEATSQTSFRSSFIDYSVTEAFDRFHPKKQLPPCAQSHLGKRTLISRSTSMSRGHERIGKRIRFTNAGGSVEP